MKVEQNNQTKQVIIKIKIEGERFGTLIKHKCFDDNIDYVLEMIGILEHLKSEMLKKLERKNEI